MNLDTYLELVENCPGGLIDLGYCKVTRLNYELGIGDNSPIFLSGNYTEVLKDLVESTNSNSFFSGSYTPSLGYVPSFTDVKKGDVVPTIRFNDSHNDVYFEFYNGLVNWSRTNDDPDFFHFNRQEKDFNLSFILHSRISIKSMANFVVDIGRYAQKKNFSLCFPTSYGRAHNDDFSRVVYFYPS